jgi:beta-mannosidase
MTVRGRVRSVSAHERIAVDRGWQLAASPAGTGDDLAAVATLAWHEATVPGTVASTLGDVGSLDAHDWWWRVPLGGATGVLCLDGIATLWDAWIDGVRVASGDNMFRAAEIPLAAPANVLVIRCRSVEHELAKKRPRPRWRVPMLEQQQLRWIRTTLLGRTPGWSPPWPAIGPWRGVSIEQRGTVAIGGVSIDARVEQGVGIVEVHADLGTATGATLVIERDGERMTAELSDVSIGHAGAAAHGAEIVRVGSTWTGRAIVDRPALWWPHTHGEPALYRAYVDAMIDGRIVTVELGRIGFRTISVTRDGGDFAIHVNGVRVFCRGACWTPLDARSLSASPAAYDAAIRQMVDAGMNMVRVGGTMVYEDDAFYDALDEHGVLLWQDLMFANMDYPEDAAFTEGVVTEVDQQLARLQARPSLAVICGNSEGQQQAAMSGASRERWAPALFHDVIPARVRALLPRVPYVPSSTNGGAFPHQPSRGVSSYYGVGAYLRPLDDARRSEVRFASECLAFANIPSDPMLPRVHDPRWKARSPRDLGAGWDFDDVRDHYVQRLFGVDPLALRVTDHDRYLALGRAATGEVMAQTFGEWRRARSTCGGALVWFLRDLWHGAGWGLVDAHGTPKPCWYAVRRALAPIAVAVTDEGCNGLALHVFNDRGTLLTARLEITLYRGGTIRVGHGALDVSVPAHAAIEHAAAELFEGFLDLSFAYRFGPPLADVVQVTLSAGEERLGEVFHFPGGMPRLEHDVGLSAKIVVVDDAPVLEVSTERFAHAITIEAPGYLASDNGFSLAPGTSRSIPLVMRATPPGGRLRGTVSALNAEATARFEGSR